MSRLALRTSLVGGVVVGAMLSTGAAFAGTGVVHDAAHDVAAIKLFDGGAPKPDAGRQVGDITEVRTSYVGGRVTVTAHLRKVGRTPMVEAEIKTSAGGPRFVVDGSATRGHATVELYSGGKSDEPLSCPGLRMHAKRAKGVVSVSVPATCIGSPRWVRTAFATTSMHIPSPAEFAWPGALDDAMVFLDIAGVKGISEQLWKSDDAQAPLGTRVHRS